MARDNTALISSLASAIQLNQVRGKLALTAEQEQQLNEVRPQVVNRIVQLPSPERARENEDTIRKILTAAQLSRLVELMLQEDGEKALFRPAVASRLGLSLEQRERLSAANWDPLPPPPPGGNAELQERNAWSYSQRDWEKQRNATWLAILTDEQRKQWHELKGPPARPPVFEAPRNPAIDRAKLPPPK
jgi:hypothetical protein